MRAHVIDLYSTEYSSNTRTCHKEPIKSSICRVDGTLTRHMDTDRERDRMLEEQENCLDYVLTASFRYIPTKTNQGWGERQRRKGNEDFVGQGGNGQKTESRPISVWSPELRDGLGKPTEVAGLLPPSADKRTGGKTNRIRKEFLPPGKI